jgi:hypothetical protein
MLFGLWRKRLNARLILALDDEARLVLCSFASDDLPFDDDVGVGVVSRELLNGVGESAPLLPSEMVLSDPESARFWSRFYGSVVALIYNQNLTGLLRCPFTYLVPLLTII